MDKNLAASFRVARRLFPVTEKRRNIIYFNSASTGPLSKPVKKALYDYYELTQYLEKSAIDRDALRLLIISAHSAPGFWERPRMKSGSVFQPPLVSILPPLACR